MGEVKETLCTNCIHRDVCVYKDGFLEMNKKVENILTMTRFFCELRCPYYFRKSEIILDNDTIKNRVLN